MKLVSILSTRKMPARERLACLLDVLAHLRDRRVVISAWHSTAIAWDLDLPTDF